MLNPRSGFGNRLVSGLGPWRQRFVLVALGLNSVSQALLFKPSAVLCTGVASVGKHIPVRVVFVDHAFEVLAVVN